MKAGEDAPTAATRVQEEEGGAPFEIQSEDEGERREEGETEEDHELDFLFVSKPHQYATTDEDEGNTEDDFEYDKQHIQEYSVNYDTDEVVEGEGGRTRREYSIFEHGVRSIFSTYAEWVAKRRKRKLRDVSKFLVLERIANHLANERTLLVNIIIIN